MKDIQDKKVRGRRVQSLCTWWDYEINGQAAGAKKVPFSALCVGESKCSLTFDAPPVGPEERLLLCFEGITYEAEVTFNGHTLGKMLPYCYYAFDVTSDIQTRGNTVQVALRDIGLPFGPADGWENYGGIIREVYLQTVPAVYIQDTIWRTAWTDGYTQACCSLTVETGGDAADGCGLSARLLYDGVCVVQTQQEAGTSLTFSIDHPQLWSPEHPVLYVLETTLYQAGKPVDQYTERVGFKEFRAEGNQFLLNGEVLFLRGVCRHDTWGHTEGHTLSEAQMRRDMQMIKDAGANFVRLVHYPHHPKIVELADEIGLLVSEEPGLWWSDLHNPAVTKPALEVLERTVKRDRNRVSVAFWLAFNECIFTPEFLEDAAAVCRAHDTRMVSGANCMNLAVTRELFAQNGFDFYTFHPYGDQITSVTGGVGSDGTIPLKKVFAELADKPLVFTEWGGWPVAGNPALFGRFMDEMMAAGRSGKPGETLAGMAYWSWSDMYETNRGLPACKDGILTEGLVDVERHPGVNLAVFTCKNREWNCPVPETHGVMEDYGYQPPVSNRSFTPVRLPESMNEGAWAALMEKASPMPGFSNKPRRHITHGPVLPADCPYIGALPVNLESRKPLVLDKPLEISIERTVQALYLIGQAALIGGYPLTSAPDEAVRCEVCCEDGRTITVPLRNGQEFATIFGLAGPSRIHPIAANAPRALKIVYDGNWEVYYLNILRVGLDQPCAVRSIRFVPLREDYTLLLYGVTTEDCP